MASPAMQLISLVNEHKMAKCPWSGERARHIDDWAWELAVRGGFEFSLTDLGEPTGDMNEGLYAAAIEEENASAVRMMEYHAKRQPFIALDVKPARGERRMAHMAGRRTECRLAVGSRFRWDGKFVKVTSFATDSSYVVACSYPATSYANLPKCESCGQTRYDLHNTKAEKPERIYKITVEELRAGRALERKRHPKCKLCLRPIAEGEKICDSEHICVECHAPVKTAADGKRTTLDGSYGCGMVVCNDCIREHKEKDAAHADL